MFTRPLALVCRDEIVEHYSRLTLEASRREQRALWRVRRWQLQPQRLQLLGAAEDLSLWRAADCTEQPSLLSATATAYRRSYEYLQRRCSFTSSFDCTRHVQFASR